MSKTLIVFIHDYPYNIGEPFFESEINYLSKAFDRIYVFSTTGRKNEKQTREYPENVKCFPLGISHNRIKYAFLGLFATDKNFNTKKINGKKKAYAYYLLGRNASIFRKALKIIKHNKIDLSNVVIYSYWLTIGIAAIKLSNLILKKHGYKSKCVSRCHGYDVYSEIMPLNYHPFQSEVISMMDYVCPCSEFGTKYLKNKYPVFSKKILTMRLGTEDNGVRLIPGKIEYLTIVTCSGLRAIKRLDLFAESFSEVAKVVDKIRWLCIGDGEEKEKIQSILKKNDALEKCEFIGNVSNKKVYQLYSEKFAYCFVNVSASEGIPVSIMEAISFGTPVIATNVGGNGEIVDFNNGILLKPNPSKNEITDALNNIISLSMNDYNKMRISSRKKWEEYYSSKVNYTEWSYFLKGDDNE